MYEAVFWALDENEAGEYKFLDILLPIPLAVPSLKLAENRQLHRLKRTRRFDDKMPKNVHNPDYQLSRGRFVSETILWIVLLCRSIRPRICYCLLSVTCRDF